MRFSDALVSQMTDPCCPLQTQVRQIAATSQVAAGCRKAIFFTALEQHALQFIGACPTDLVDWTPDAPCPCAKVNKTKQGAIDWKALLAMLLQLLPTILPLILPLL